MQDISLLPQWDRQTVWDHLEKSPLDFKTMKSKLQRIFAISAYNELEYVPDVLDAYTWIKTANEHPDFRKCLAADRNEKDFSQEFIHMAIKYMVICRKFKHVVLMALTQQIVVEALRYFVGHFHLLQKYPKMCNIVKWAFDHDKNFFKVNYINEHSLLVIPPSEEEIIRIDKFIENLNPGDKIDILKSQMHSKRICWVPGTVKKISSLNVHVFIDYQKGSHSFDRKSMQIVPRGQKKQFYQWRIDLKVDDQIDIQDIYGNWIVGKVAETREYEDSENPSQKLIDLRIVCDCAEIEWVCITDPRIQKLGSLTNQPGTKLQRNASQNYLDDYNDILFDPEMTCFAVCRHQVCKSLMMMGFIDYAHKQLKLFDLIADAVKSKRFNIQVTSELISIVSQVHPIMHRKFATTYLEGLTTSIFEYVNKADEMTIRNFSKERYQNVLASINEFLKRLKPTSQRKLISQTLQLDLLLRFINSDFLDRKLHAIALLTALLKLSKHNTLKRSQKQFLEWIKQNNILQTLYNDKSHSELISRSADFLQFYLLTQPDIQQLNPLLQWNEAILKLVNDSFDYFPDQFKNKMVEKIKQKTDVTNKDALDIIKRVPGCQNWLLQNGGQSWVSVVKQKSKKKSDIAEVFKCPFNVVEKITKQIADLYECKFRNQYFMYLHEINYLGEVLGDEKISLEKRLAFAELTIQPLSNINEPIYNAIHPFTQKVNDSISEEFQDFFVNLLQKMTKRHINHLFETNFTVKQNIQTLGTGQIKLFKNTFLLINQEKKTIEKKVVYHYPTPHSYKKEKKEILTIKVNPNQLIGMKELMIIIFENKNIEVTQTALEFIGFLFDHLAKELAESAVEFKSKFLQSCLEEFYKTKDQQQKYLKIIEKLMNQSEKEGIDEVPSASAMFPYQTITIRVIDHFNVTKKKLVMEVPANFTLYELRAEIARHINAYVYEMKIMFGDSELDPRLNGHVIHTLDLTSQDLIIEKKVNVEKVNLSQTDGTLTEKCKNIFKLIFKEFSLGGYMSKAQCQKYHQRCVGEVTSMSQSKVDKIYEVHDEDRDGYLTESDFLKFYQNAVQNRESAVWSNLQTFGIRNDLEILYENKIEYPEGQHLTRHLLFNNKKFMHLLLDLLQSEDENLAKSAWKVISRLPLLSDEDFFYEGHKFQLCRKYMLRYWLCIVDKEKDYKMIQEHHLEQIMNSDIQTQCIGLKCAINSPDFNLQFFNKAFLNLKKLNSQINLDFYSKVVLFNTLQMLDYYIKTNGAIKDHYISEHSEYDSILTAGLMSKNKQIRKMYCSALFKIVEATVDLDFQLFESFFNLIYKNFQKCDKSTLSIEYFDLYSNVLQVLKIHSSLLQKLQLNWLILTKSMIELYITHKCTQTSLNSKPDQVAQGFLRIIRKLLDENTVKQLIPLVRYIFQNSLFPQTGQNKLKNSKSRKDAYELIYEICKIKDTDNSSSGLNQLFNSGFKNVYKKMSQNKTTSYSLSYFYSYNEARSELGYAGLRNLGCICYMIAMLQQLYMTKPFRNLILMADDGQPQCLTKKGTKEVDDNLFHQLKIMFANLELTEKQDFNPDEFCFAFKDFEGMPVNVSVQQDAQEFLNLFFDKMQESLKGTPFKHIFENVFGGKTCNQTICSNCKAINERQETFYPLSLEIKGYKNIEQSFNKFIKGEVISDYQCDSCQKKTDVTKSCYLAKVPNHFIIHLQRMCFNYDKFENQKVNSRWEFPMKLNVYDYSLDKQKNINSKAEYDYELKGIVLHYGSADFGHYFSYIKESQNHWIEFNDERVREFDPRDIEIDCFGGEHWRRESQSAYLLVYEKVKKSQIKLEFSSEEQKSKMISQFMLHDSIIEKAEVGNPKQAKEQDKKQEQKIYDNQKSQKGESQQGQSQVKQTQQKAPSIPLFLSMQNVPTYVPQDLKAKINKTNEEFSFTINLSNDEFAYFIHKILSIDPPPNLTTEYLELCYECFHLKQIIDQSNGTSLSEWASNRFKEIINGHGWEFLKIFGQNWESDILSIERTTRIGMKNLLECVMNDIIKSNHLNEEEQVVQEQTDPEKAKQYEEKRNIILQFLEKYTDMLYGEVAKNWARFKQYFEVWLELVKENRFVRRYCEQKMMIERILDFILEDESPFKRSFKRYPLGNQHYPAEFEHPLEFMTLLIKFGYELNELEKKSMKNYAFMQKIIKFPTKHCNLVEFVCKDNNVLSQKFAYLILIQTAKVGQSDEVKPIILTIHKFLDIKDDLQQKRVEWILGFPQYIENPKTSSYGLFGLNPDQDYLLNYVSPVRAVPILQQILKFKIKAQHVAALLISMLLQLQADGHINNLEQIPSAFAFTKDYLFWFEEFIDSYYDDTHRTFIAKHYTEYGNRLKNLWVKRPKRPFQHYQKYMIGRTTLKECVKQEQFNEFIEINLIDVTSSLLPLTEENEFITKKNIKNFEKSQNFRVKLTSPYGHSSFLSVDRSNHSSDEEESLTEGAKVNPFQKAIEGKLFRKLVIKNLSCENLLIVVKIKSQSIEPNIYLSRSEASFQIKGQSSISYTLMKKRLQEPFDEITLSISVLGKATREGYWPRQILTEVSDDKQQEGKEGSDVDLDQDSTSWAV